MALKILGQVAPAATTEVDVYTAPGGAETVVSSITVCNRGADGTYRVSVRQGGGATANKDYVAYDAPIRANDTVVIVAGITMAATDVLRFYNSNGNMSMSAFGQETV